MLNIILAGKKEKAFKINRRFFREFEFDTIPGKVRYSWFSIGNPPFNVLKWDKKFQIGNFFDCGNASADHLNGIENFTLPSYHGEYHGNDEASFHFLLTVGIRIETIILVFHRILDLNGAGFLSWPFFYCPKTRIIS